MAIRCTALPDVEEIMLSSAQMRVLDDLLLRISSSLEANREDLRSMYVDRIVVETELPAIDPIVMMLPRILQHYGWGMVIGEEEGATELIILPPRVRYPTGGDTVFQ